MPTPGLVVSGSVTGPRNDDLGEGDSPVESAAAPLDTCRDDGAMRPPPIIRGLLTLDELCSSP